MSAKGIMELINVGEIRHYQSIVGLQIKHTVKYKYVNFNFLKIERHRIIRCAYEDKADRIFF